MTPREVRRARVRALVAAEPAGQDAGTLGTAGWLDRLCRAAVRALPATGAGISLMTADGVRGVAAASKPAYAALEEVQFTLGEGPSVEAFTLQRPVLEPDLDAASAGRWPGYRGAAQRAGMGASFAFPLQIGAARLGVLGIHRRSAGALPPDALTQALTFAEVAVETLLDGQEHTMPGTATTTLDPMFGPTLDPTLDRALESQFAVYQAQGMAMVDLGVSLTDAMARLQAHAYANDRTLQDVARDIVAGRLRLEPDPP
jgi:hypothetical protein